ncbi:MAG: AraC family transcriptional regulator [Vicinamibacteraceae bacterium]
MDVEIKEMPELRVGTLRHIGPYTQISQAFERLGAIAGPAGLFQQPGAAMMAIYHDDPRVVSPDQLRSDAAIVVPENVALPEGLAEQRVAAGRYACAVHIGPYEKLDGVWARFLGEWLPASGHRMSAGASYEIYRNDPTKVPKAELRTDMYLPVA